MKPINENEIRLLMPLKKYPNDLRNLLLVNRQILIVKTMLKKMKSQFSKSYDFITPLAKVMDDVIKECKDLTEIRDLMGDYPIRKRRYKDKFYIGYHILEHRIKKKLKRVSELSSLCGVDEKIISNYENLYSQYVENEDEVLHKICTSLDIDYDTLFIPVSSVQWDNLQESAFSKGYTTPVKYYDNKE